MATRKQGSPRGRAFLPFLLGFAAAVVALLAGGWAYLSYGHPPVAASDPAFPMEAQIVHVPLGKRIEREMQQPPFGTSEDVYEAGAHVYVQQCAACHGTPGKDVAYAAWMFPSTPQLFKKHAHGNVVGVSDDEPGETFWKIKNGIRLSGMPSYQNILSTEQMWDVTLLLKNADQQLPDPVSNILAKK